MRSARKLAVSAISLLVVFFTLVTTTYAWIASSSSLEIGNIAIGASKDDNYLFSLDGGLNYVKSFSGDDIYERLSVLYPEYESYYFELQNKGTLANPKWVKNYKYMYKLVTPLALENGFVSKFYMMQHTVVENKVGFIFYNKTDILNEDETVLENQYSPLSGYIRVPITIKSSVDSMIYLSSYEVVMNGRNLRNDIASTSMLRIGFETDLYNVSKYNDTEINPYYVESEYEEINGIKTNTSKHIKIFEPVKEFSDSMSDYLGGYLYNTTGYGKYFSNGYIDDFVYDMRKPGSLLVQNPNDSTNFIFNEEYVNNYGSSIDKKYNFNYINDVLETKKNELTPLIFETNQNNEIEYKNLDTSFDNYEKATPILKLEKDVPSQIYMYIWIEGWDGAACDFSQLGRFSFSMRLMEVKL